MSNLDTYFCLEAAANFYVNIRILSIEMQKLTQVRIEESEVAIIAYDLSLAGFFRRLRYDVEEEVYEDFRAPTEVTELDWFEITPEGRLELNRLALE